MKKWFKFKYPKIFLLIVSIVFAYFLFKEPHIADFILGIGKLRYIGLFIAGMLFAFGFTAPIAVGFFISYQPQNLILASLTAGLGAMISNLLIFNFIRFSFKDEFNRLKKAKAIKEINQFIGKEFGGHIRRYLMFAFAGILIASPLPDEAASIMLAGLTKINQITLAIITFGLSTIGIAVLLAF